MRIPELISEPSNVRSGRHRLIPLSIALAVVMAGCDQTLDEFLIDEPIITNVIEGVMYEPGNWEPMLAAGEEGRSWGNHRAVVRVDSGQENVWARIPWRRRDTEPGKKAVVIVDASTDSVVTNTAVIRIDNESGDVIFEPNDGSLLYHVYYFPYETNGGYYPRVDYITPETFSTDFAPDADWMSSLGSLSETDIDRFPKAEILSIQSVDAFHSFYPMETIATREEVDSLLEDRHRTYYLFPEDREHPIRMRRYLPIRWVDRGLSDTTIVASRRGEYFTFQIGVYAHEQDLEEISVQYGDFVSLAGGRIESTAFTCFNLGGIDLSGQPFTKHVSIQQGEVQPLWIGVQIPNDARPGPYEGNVTVAPTNAPEQTLRIRMEVSGDKVQSFGDDDPEYMSRLRWLNSTTGTDPDFIIDPFEPVVVEGAKLRILGREVELSASGLPNSISSFFTPELTGFAAEPTEILAQPLSPEILVNDEKESWTSSAFDIVQVARGRAEWAVHNESEYFSLEVNGAIEYDGMLDYSLTLVAKQNVDVSDVALPVVLQPSAATYVLGLGQKGQQRPDSIDWKWAIENHQEGVWLGNVHKGLQYVLRDENYERPLNTNFYQAKPLNMPTSWYNGGKGGIRIRTTPDGVVARNYSGPRRIEAGEALNFNIRFLITPFKPIDTRAHFNTRFVHKYVPVDSVLQWGGTVVNVHHANEINPYINYPFFNLDLQTAYIEEAHDKGVKVKLYNTIRELTYKSHELFALRSLDFEILNDGNGGGHSWLQEHLVDQYHSAWHAYRVDDAAILNKGTSRWTNYYVEGLNWLAKNQEIDGLYLDDIAFSRETVKRMISVLNRHRDDILIDLHSANQFNPRDGHINSAMLYMEHFPFITRLWFGEYFEYDKDQDYWMTEISGLPFGLMGEMLQDCGRPYRGMLYGMTTRMYGNCDPRPIWQLFDDFVIDESRMLGYWVESSPVTTDHDRVLATTYVRDEQVLIALASFVAEDVEILLSIDWDQIGFNPDVAALTAPAMAGLQSAESQDVDRPIRIPGDGGLLLLLSSDNN